MRRTLTFILLAIFISALTALYLKTPFLIASAIEESLTDIGLMDVQVGHVSPGLVASNIKTLSFKTPLRYKNFDLGLVKVVVNNIDLSYSLDALRTRLLDKFTVQNIEIVLLDDAEIDDESLAIKMQLSKDNSLLLENINVTDLSMALLGESDAVPLTASLNNIRLKLPYMIWGDEVLTNVEINFSSNKISYVDKNLSLQGDLRIVADYAGSVNLGSLMLDTKFSWGENKLHADMQLIAVEKNISLKAQLMHDVLSNKGDIRINMPRVVLQKDSFHLSHFMPVWSYPFDLHAGAVILSGKINWVDGDVNNMRWVVELDDIDGHYEDWVISGISTKAIVVKKKKSYQITMSDLSVSHIDSGVALSDIQAKINVLLPMNEAAVVVNINDLRGSVLGGNFSTSDVVLDMSRSENQLLLQIEGVDLAQILAVQSQQGLSGTGVMDGRIPITITTEGIRVEQGKVWVREPGGELHYKTDASSQALVDSNVQLQLLMEVLENFHYHALSSTVEFLPQGDLLLEVKLKGRNPDMQGGREVNFNLNVEQNILTLLKSLRFTDNVSEIIGQKLNK